MAIPLGAASARVNVGFYGSGRLARANLAACANVPGFAVAGIWAEEQQAEPGGLRAMLADASLDAVCLSVSESRHAWMTVEACQAGKDVYVEVPARPCPDDGARMAGAARRYGRVVQTGAAERSGALFRAARAIVKSGELGEIAYCRIRGDAALLDLVHFVFDEPEPVSATAQGGPGWSLATYRYPGFVVSIEGGADARPGAGEIAIHGARATLRADGGGCRIFRSGAGQAVFVEARGAGGDARVRHWRNWLEAIQARRQPAAGIEARVRVAGACRLFDLALRRRRTVGWRDARGAAEV